MLKFDWNILWTIINLILLFVLMRLFLFKPIKKVLDKRRELIENQFKEADEKEKSATQLYNEYKAQLDGVEGEKKQIIADARANAKNEYNKIVDKAQEDADKIKTDARRAAEIETEKARRAVKEEIAAFAMETAAKVVGSQSGAEIDSSLYDEFLNESSDNSDK